MTVRQKNKKKEDCYHHQGLRQALIEEACQIVKNDGQGKLSLRLLARKLGVSHAAPYRHFKSKEDLIMAIAHDGLLELQSEILLEINKYDEYSEEQIHDAVCAYMEFALKNPERFVLMFKIMITDSRITFKKCPQLRKLAHQSFQALIDYIHEGQKRKIFDPGDPSFISLSLWSMIHGLSMMAVTDYLQNIGIKATWKKDVVNHLTNLLCNARQRR